jgi:hypothetical protein
MTVQELISLFSKYRHRTNDVEISQMCGLGASATTAKLKTTTPIVFFHYNQQVNFAANAVINMTACTQQPSSSFCYYLVSVDLLGVVTVTKGANNTYSLPPTPAGSSPVGAFLISTDGSATFTSGTTSFSATGVTATFFDIDCGISLSLINQAQKRLERGVTIVRKGSRRTLMDFDYMMVRATVSLSPGDDVFILPFPNFKDFTDQGINVTDSSGLTTRLEKEDILSSGISDFQGRPCKVSRRIVQETVFTTDGFPGMEFSVWPKCDQAYTLDIQAYQYSPDLDGVIYSSNWLTENAPDILLFGALSESGMYFGTDPQTKEWEARWQEAVWTLYASQEKSKYSGSHIGTKFPDPLRLRSGFGMASNKEGILSYGFIDAG